MKPQTKKLIALATLLIIFMGVGCEKDEIEDNPEDNIIVGGLYQTYAGIPANPCDVNVNIMDEIYTFNKSEAYYGSHQPTTNQNVFQIYLSDTISDRIIDFEIFTPYIEPEDFFTKSTFNIDTLKISWAYVREDFYNVNATFAWDTVWYEHSSFTGKASFDIPEEIVGTINSNTFYPKQTIEFEFK